MQSSPCSLSRPHSLTLKLHTQHRQKHINTLRHKARTESLFSLLGFPNIISLTSTNSPLPISSLLLQLIPHFKSQNPIYTQSGLQILITLLTSPYYHTQCKQQIARLNLDHLLVQNFIHGELVEFNLLFCRLLSILLEDEEMGERLGDYHYHIVLFMSHLVGRAGEGVGKGEELVLECLKSLYVLSREYQIDVETVGSVIEVVCEGGERVLEAGLGVLLRYYEKVFDGDELVESCEDMVRLGERLVGSRFEGKEVMELLEKILETLLNKKVEGANEESVGECLESVQKRMKSKNEFIENQIKETSFKEFAKEITYSDHQNNCWNRIGKGIIIYETN